MKLKCRKETVIYVTKKALSEFIEKVYGREYDYEENNAYQDTDIYIEVLDTVNVIDKEDIEEFKNGGKCRIYPLLYSLCHRTLIEKGQYCIQQ